MSFDKCQKAYTDANSALGLYEESMVCAYGPVSNYQNMPFIQHFKMILKQDKNVCENDGGGPLACQGKLVGIASIENQNRCSPTLPGVFTRITKFVDWIEAHAEYQPPTTSSTTETLSTTSEANKSHLFNFLLLSIILMVESCFLALPI